MYVLLVAPDAPPKNSPEAIQVHRYLLELARVDRVTLVTTPVERGWTRADPELSLQHPNVDRLELKLPLHRLALRVFMSPLAERLRRPDKDAWIQWYQGHVVRCLKRVPDVVYSRSSPFSAALLAGKIARSLRRPWVMHLSDPWADSPYRNGHEAFEHDQEMEESCFEQAAAVTLTTEGQLRFYAAKYPQHAHKLRVSPNVLPSQLDGHVKQPSGPLHIVYTGALYGQRRLTPILRALQLLKAGNEHALRGIRLSVAGNMTADIRDEVDAAALPNVSLLGPLPQAEVKVLLQSADVLLSIEPVGEHELLNAFFPSKLLDYLGARRPIIAITPRDSEAARLCADGFGWAFHPDDATALAERLYQLTTLLPVSSPHEALVLPELPSRFMAGTSVGHLQGLFASLAVTGR